MPAGKVDSSNSQENLRYSHF
jgi:hypothetical protein